MTPLGSEQEDGRRRSVRPVRVDPPCRTGRNPGVLCGEALPLEKRNTNQPGEVRKLARLHCYSISSVELCTQPLSRVVKFSLEAKNP